MYDPDNAFYNDYDEDRANEQLEYYDNDYEDEEEDDDSSSSR